VKLIQAAALVAALVPLGSIAMEGASISCGFSGAGNMSSSGCAGGGSTQIFNFDQTASAADDYKVILTFLGMDNPFNMTVTDHTLSHTAFLAREGLAAGTYDCVNMVSPTLGDPCREFEFESNNGIQWDGYTFEFVWDYDSENSGFPNGTDPVGDAPGAIRVVQNKGLSQLGAFTIDMCLEAMTNDDFTPCSYQAVSTGDPRIGSGNTDFSTAVVASVPEPSSLILLCAGAGVLYRRRRRSKLA
jgi:hypothetical protein